jgi:hypothetical protein
MDPFVRAGALWGSRTCRRFLGAPVWTLSLTRIPIELLEALLGVPVELLGAPVEMLCLYCTQVHPLVCPFQHLCAFVFLQQGLVQIKLENMILAI